MKEEESKDNQRPEEKKPALIPEERLSDILSILFPHGYSHYDGVKYTGVSPYIGSTHNIITVVANDLDGWGKPFYICMEKFTDDDDEEEANNLGFYKGIMKIIAPELHCSEKEFNGICNVLEFGWADERTRANAFPVEVRYMAQDV